MAATTMRRALRQLFRTDRQIFGHYSADDGHKFREIAKILDFSAK